MEICFNLKFFVVFIKALVAVIFFSIIVYRGSKNNIGYDTLNEFKCLILIQWEMIVRLLTTGTILGWHELCAFLVSAKRRKCWKRRRRKGQCRSTEPNTIKYMMMNIKLRISQITLILWVVLYIHAKLDQHSNWTVLLFE